MEASLDLYADVLLNPAFPDKEFNRLKKDQMSRIQREKATPIQMALRVFPQYLYGKDPTQKTKKSYFCTVELIMNPEVSGEFWSFE